MRQQKRNVLLVDSGDLFAPPGYNLHALPEKDKKLTALKVNLFMEAYNLMKYDAFTPGEIELSLGISELQKISKQGRFVFLLANLLNRQTKKPVFRPYLIKEIGGIKIGLLGLLSTNLAGHIPPRDKETYEVNDSVEAAGKIIEELKRKNCQVIIAIGHMEEREQRKLAETYKEIYFVIGGHERPLKRQPLEIRNAQIINAGTRGEYLGQMEFFLRERVGEKRLFSHYQIIALNERYADHPQITKLVDQFLVESKKLYPSKKMTSIPDRDPWRQNRPFTYQVSNYMGDQFCLPCHEQQYEKWKKTRHAKAYHSLVGLKRELDHMCLPCHSTGFREVSGVGDVLVNVQCESCHGPRRGHPADGLKFAPVTEKQCLTCHNPAKSPNFDYNAYVTKVRCPSSTSANKNGKDE